MVNVFLTQAPFQSASLCFHHSNGNKLPSSKYSPDVLPRNICLKALTETHTPPSDSSTVLQVLWFQNRIWCGCYR